MIIFELKASPLDKDGDELDWSILSEKPDPSTIDVKKETDALFAIHLECQQRSEKNPEGPFDPEDSPAKVFANAAIKWLSVTGGWDNIDKSIRDRYPELFLDAIRLYSHNIPVLKAYSEALKQSKAQLEADAACTSTILRIPRPYDIGRATYELWETAHRSIRPEGTCPNKIDDHFIRLADVWWRETGGPANIDPDILAPYKSWFIGKLIMHRHHQEMFRQTELDSAIDPLKFDVESATRDLFKRAEQLHWLARLMSGVAAMQSDSPVAQHEKDLRLREVHWCQMTGGWQNVDKQIRDSYPEWFVKRLADVNKSLPLAKLMAYEWWHRDFVKEHNKND
ncbi:hypothetical protein PSEUBRA_000827 [Kalmanozyma brasiliensis GHG001]|uniref:uncharacterized protein n=1 Tax=Kalmanozyma brasiliensis (strain GHG001) TaxID=1365824 RepID=UPI002867C7D5|nr:uncharacterized protein PSEUBRA_000827 [Kalmanozyma brasiliensis GHG001]KAF6766848.1 hypothetical protein PSEUBRA_000827 [Kalmanozyma brasiliensis GHG001]